MQIEGIDHICLPLRKATKSLVTSHGFGSKKCRPLCAPSHETFHSWNWWSPISTQVQLLGNTPLASQTKIMDHWSDQLWDKFTLNHYQLLWRAKINATLLRRIPYWVDFYLQTGSTLMGMYEFFSINLRVCILNDNSDIGTHILAPKRIQCHILFGTKKKYVLNRT